MFLCKLWLFLDQRSESHGQRRQSSKWPKEEQGEESRGLLRVLYDQIWERHKGKFHVRYWLMFHSATNWPIFPLPASPEWLSSGFFKRWQILFAGQNDFNHALQLQRCFKSSYKVEKKNTTQQIDKYFSIYVCLIGLSPFQVKLWRFLCSQAEPWRRSSSRRDYFFLRQRGGREECWHQPRPVQEQGFWMQTDVQTEFTHFSRSEIVSGRGEHGPRSWTRWPCFKH